MQCNGLASFVSVVRRVNDDKRNVVLFTTGGRAFARQAMSTGQLTAIGSESYDGIIGDVFENNEAFALNNILLQRMLGVPYEKLNLFGGAVALGHPLGASGARIIVTLLNVMDHCDSRRGIAAICHGSGGGTALAVERMGGR